MLTIHVLLTPQCLSSAYVLPIEMLNGALQQAKASRLVRSKQNLQVQFITSNDASIESSSCLKLAPTLCLDDAMYESPDIILIPTLWRQVDKVLRHCHGFVEYLQFQQAASPTICAVSTGSSLLALSGLLDHKAATSHWSYIEQMRQQFPLTTWKSNYPITQAGNIYCAGSVNAVADVCVYLIEQFFNAQIAKHIASQFSPEVRQPLQTQLFSENSRSVDDEVVAEVLDQLNQENSNATATTRIDALAKQAGLSARSLQRRFKQTTGQSISEYRKSLRIERAKDLLKASNASIHEIAALSGFNDVSHMSKTFQRHEGMSPSNFRKSVRGKLFN